MAASRWERPVWVGAATVAYVLTTGFLVWSYWRLQVDLDVYRLGGVTLLHGHDPYRAALPGNGLSFTYPPSAALAFVSLGILPEAAARIAAGMLSAGALALITFTTLKQVAPHWPRLKQWTVTLAVSTAAAVGLEPVRETFHFGQVNLILAALVLWDICANRGRHRGGLIGLATAIKLTPAIFILYMLVTRRLRAAITAVVTTLVLILAAALVVPSASQRYWTGRVFETSRIARAGIGVVWNQSLLGALARTTGSAHPTNVVWLPAAAIIFATGLWLAADCYKAGNEALGVVTTAVTGLLVSPVSWDHHWVWALPVAILLAGWTGRTRWVLLGWIAISALAPAAWSLPRYQWGYPATLLGNLVTDAYVLMALALAAMLAAASLNRRFRYASRLAGGERAEVSHGESVQGTWSRRSR